MEVQPASRAHVRSPPRESDGNFTTSLAADTDTTSNNLAQKARFLQESFFDATALQACTSGDGCRLVH